MPALRALALAAALPLLAASTAGAQGGAFTLRTRPERTDYRETSRYDEVVAFLEAAQRAAPEMVHLTTMGYSFEGRPLPLVVWGRVPDASPGAARATGRTRVYVQGNIHAGEVEGKEATLALLRGLVNREHRGWADSLVLLIAPIYNADGNERVSLVNRPHQHGPVGGMGQRPNAQGLDLNRDHTKLDSPEARSLLDMLNRYDPHVLLDLHTTNGTYHAYHLTYAPPLHPTTPAAVTALLRGDWLPAVSRGLKSRDGWDTYHYGNVPGPESTWAAAPGAERAWYTFDHRPRFGNNYAGLRGRFGILGEAYAYLTFRERIETTRRFVEEVLDYAHANAGRIRRVTEAADRAPVVGEALALRARTRRGPHPVEVLMGAVREERNPYTGEPMMRRLDVKRPERMPEYGSFEATETDRAPRAYLVPPALAAVVERLGVHGVRFRALERPTKVRVEEFRIDSAQAAAQPFQGHRERTLFGRYAAAAERELPAGTLVVPVDQPLGRLAFVLLEPRSDDGFASWGLLDEALVDARAYPVLRTRDAVP
ncbi:MAG TPA: M14 family metallopeptidase [Longimicrobiaceae bacterium]|nr:M14 family metallopeptidase [Longimicrobiaceae bacterium]